MKLADAVRALHDEGALPSETANETRARIVAALQKKKRRRSRVVLLVLPMAAVLVGASASAAVGGRLPAVWRSIASVLGFATGGGPDPRDPVEPRAFASARSTNEADRAFPPVREVAATASDAQDRPEGEIALPSAPASEPAAVAPEITPRPPRARTAASPPSASQLSTSSQPSGSAIPPPAIVENPEPSRVPDVIALYRAAHRLHFAARDPAAALVAWDAYLRADPAGSFALEARYNRALCLIRLRRSAEARQALVPFADGAFGGYRQSEARALLETMDGASDADR